MTPRAVPFAPHHVEGAQPMADYDLYYWPVPFRGQFIRAILAHAGKSWTEHDGDEIGALMEKAAADQPVPFIGPPLLIDHKTGFALSQMPAIALYLGETLDLLPSSPQGRATSIKLVNDANDIIDELTLDGGREMWTKQSWEDFQPRLSRWMAIWERFAETGGVEADSGFLLGTDAPGLVDIVGSTLWSTMTDRFPAIATLLDKTAPRIAGLSRRIQQIPALADLDRSSRAQYGDAYCGGEIEKSLRKVAG